MRHLTDRQLQLYLENGSKIDPSVRNHLHACDRCQRQLETYGQVYAALSNDAGFDLRPGLAESVMARLAAQPEPERVFPLPVVAAVSVGAAILLNAILFAISVIPWTGAFLRAFYASVVTFIGEIAVAIVSTAGSSGVQPGVLVSILLILAASAVLERVIALARTRHFSF